jgi:MarR family transcriptional regulator, organic hydroperoxide resistance regulator
MDSQQLKLSNQVCFPLYSVSRLLTKAYKPHLDELGVTYPQYLVLMVLWENDGLTVNQIAKKLLLNTNTLSPLLKRMEKMEILERNRSSNDERIVIIQLTDKGKQLRIQAMPIPEKLMNTFLKADVSLDDVIQLKDTLCDWIKILSEDDKNTD